MRVLTINMKKVAAAGSLCALLLAAPAPAAARGTVTVEVVYEGVIGCGLGIFIYFAGSWEAPFAPRGLQSALLEFSDGRARVGVPVPALRFGSDPAGEQSSHDSIQFDLLRWRF